jgi:hypothetical protein
MEQAKVRILASYLPQFHPIPENDEWWGKGFTEWTNVGRAKPLFRGHYQPKVPSELGYYDLRLPEVRQAQADLAKEHGIEGFCYWHYWFGNGKQLLERPFNEVLASGKPDFPICLGWANHNWEDKQFSKKGSNKLLMKQLYPGEDDFILHFHTVLPAFRDKRYVRVNNKPVFLIYDPKALPDVSGFINLWQKLARENGLEGVHFIANTHNIEDINSLKEVGFDAINILRFFHFMKHELSLLERARMKFSRIVLKRGKAYDYKMAARYFQGEEDRLEHCYPSLISNWDHSPRSGKNGHIFVNATPQAFKAHIKKVFELIKHKPPEHRIVILKSWNEWGEGSYVEPDLKYGRGYLEAIKSAIDEFKVK